MKKLDEVYDIYQDFLDCVDERMIEQDTVTALDGGKEKAILEFSNGFIVELMNDPKLEEGAYLRCWWDGEEDNVVEITTLEQLTHEFNRS